MKKLLIRLAILTGIAFAIRTVLADEEKRLALQRRSVGMLEHMVERIPEDSPPKAIMSGLRHVQEQNDKVVSLLEEQNELLRQGAEARKPSAAA